MGGMGRMLPMRSKVQCIGRILCKNAADGVSDRCRNTETVVGACGGQQSSYSVPGWFWGEAQGLDGRSVRVKCRARSSLSDARLGGAVSACVRSRIPEIIWYIR